VPAEAAPTGNGGGAATTKAPKSYTANCAGSSDGRVAKRITTPEYWSTYAGGIINKNSHKEFFSITNNPYSSSCDAWYKKYVRAQFHKSLVVAYDKDITGATSYWGYTDSSNNRREAENVGLKACNASPNKTKSHICVILFSNNDIKNPSYLALAKSTIPTNASKTDSGWTCNTGFKKSGNGCKKETIVIPKNASASGSSWACNTGYIKTGNSCKKTIVIPANAKASGSSWVCNSGYTKKFSVNQNTGATEGSCIKKLILPANAYASGSSWACNQGFTKTGNSCKKTIIIPPNAYASGSSWECNTGFVKAANRCLIVPANAYASGSSWACNPGFTKTGNSCKKTIIIPPNAKASGSSWACNPGFTKTGKTCTNTAELKRIKEAKKIAEAKAAKARKEEQLDAQNYFNDLLEFLKINNTEYDIIEIVGLVGTNKAILTEPWNKILKSNFEELKSFTSTSQVFRDFHNEKNDGRKKVVLNEFAVENERLKNINAYLRFYVQNNIISDIAQDVLKQIKIGTNGLKNQDLNELSKISTQLEQFIAKNNLSKDYLKFIKALSKNKANDPKVNAQKIDATDLVSFDFMKKANRADYLALVNLSGKAPNALLNLEGDVVFENDRALSCFYQSKGTVKNDLKYYLYDVISDKEFLVEDKDFECNQNNLLSYDLIFFEKGALVKESKSYVASLAAAIGNNELQLFRKITKEQRNKDFDSRETKARTIIEGLEDEMILGFGSLIIDNDNTTLCTDVKNTLGQASIMRLLSNEFKRMGYGKSVSNVSFNSVENTFTNVQKGRCGFIYAGEGTLATLLNAFKASGTKYDVLPVWYSKKMVKKEQLRQDSKEQSEMIEDQKVKEQMDKDQKLAELRAEADGIIKKEQQDRLRKLNRNIVKSHVQLVKKEAALWLDEDPENTGKMLSLYPSLESFIKKKLKESWELDKLDTEISDYGLSDFRNRIIESFITDINFTLKNRTLGEYEDFCVRVAILDDKEFEVLREPKMSDCSPGSMDSYKKRLDFQSSWVVR